MDLVAEQWRRILKPNGSLYCFASPKMSARVEVKLAERFAVLNRLHWIKEMDRGKHAASCKDALRCFFPNTEAIIFCEQYGADSSAKGGNGYGAECDKLRGFIFEPLRAYLDGERRRAGVSVAAIAKERGCTATMIAQHHFSSSQWNIPTQKTYEAMQSAAPGYFTRPYEDLRAEYEDLCAEYEDLRRPFQVSSEVPYTDVWTFPTVSNYPGKHPCEKPAPLLEHIISASSKPGAVVLDSFAGSGSTLLAAKKLGRQFIGIEIDPHWVDFANRRIGNFSQSVQSAPGQCEGTAPVLSQKAKREESVLDGAQLSLF